MSIQRYIDTFRQNSTLYFKNFCLNVNLFTSQHCYVAAHWHTFSHIHSSSAKQFVFILLFIYSYVDSSMEEERAKIAALSPV